LQTNSWMLALSRALVHSSKSLATDVGSLVGVYYEPVGNKARLHLIVNGLCVRMKHDIRRSDKVCAVGELLCPFNHDRNVNVYLQ
jgi:hypothetical protein